jgi:hypothetical protein
VQNIMDRVTIAALVVATCSLCASFVFQRDAALTVKFAIALLIPLAVIAFPEACEAALRSTLRGRAHSDERPTPSFMVRLAAWVLLVVLVVVHHSLTFARVPD